MRSLVRTSCTFFTLWLGLVTISAPSAQAQTVAEPNTVTVTPFLAASFGVSNNLDSSMGLGVAVGYDLTSNLGFEFELGHVFDVVGDDDNLDWSLTNYSGNVLYYFNRVPRVLPYATFGIGWERSTLDFETPDPAALTIPSSTEIAWNFGGGAKMELNDRLIARADIRRFQVNDAAPDHWRLYGGLTFYVKR
jgi:opacity protein-like surface antigen